VQGQRRGLTFNVLLIARKSDRVFLTSLAINKVSRAGILSRPALYLAGTIK